MARNMKKFPNKNPQKALSPEKSLRKNLINGVKREDKVSFSFRFYKQIDNFGITGKKDVWMSGLLKQLSVLSNMNADELLGDKKLKGDLRMHGIIWEVGKTALKKSDFNDIPEEFHVDTEECPIMQFQISKATGRVIGFFNENHTVFYIVFLDPNHNAQLCKYNDYKLRKIDPCESEIDDLMARIAKHAGLQKTLMEDAEDFLYAGNDAYFCINNELFNVLIQLVEDKKELQFKLEEFLLNNL